MPKRSRRRRQQQPQRQVEGGMAFLSKLVDNFKHQTLEEQEESIELTLQPVEKEQEVVLLLDHLLKGQLHAAPYYTTFKQAVQLTKACTETTQRQEAIEKLWKVFQQASELGKWAPGRVSMFFHIVDTISKTGSETQRNMRQEDLRQLQQLFHDEHELTVVRQMGAHCIVNHMPWYANISPEETMEICREALHLEPTTKEFQGRVVILEQDTSERTASVAKIIDTCKAYLHKRCDPEEKEINQVDGVWKSNDGREVICPGKYDPGLYCRTCLIGGCQCDYCGTTVEELGVTKLRMCCVCRNAYYCGEDCQLKAWKKGHSRACRPAGDVCSGDIMRIMRHKKKLEWNGRLVNIVHRHDTKEKVWWVGFYAEGDESDLFPVKTKYLVHIRPEA